VGAPEKPCHRPDLGTPCGKGKVRALSLEKRDAKPPSRLEALRLFGAGFFYFAHAALGALGALQASLALALNPQLLGQGGHRKPRERAEPATGSCSAPAPSELKSRYTVGMAVNSRR
jgi:hypothetical protein